MTDISNIQHLIKIIPIHEENTEEINDNMCF